MVRDRHGWKPGAPLQLVDDGEGVRLATGPEAAALPCRGLTVHEGHLVYDAAWNVPPEEAIAQALADDRAERDRHLAGG